jgi:hypothetical protein
MYSDFYSDGTPVSPKSFGKRLWKPLKSFQNIYFLSRKEMVNFRILFRTDPDVPTRWNYVHASFWMQSKARWPSIAAGELFLVRRRVLLNAKMRFFAFNRTPFRANERSVDNRSNGIVHFIYRRRNFHGRFSILLVHHGATWCESLDKVVENFRKE